MKESNYYMILRDILSGMTLKHQKTYVIDIFKHGNNGGQKIGAMPDASGFRMTELYEDKAISFNEKDKADTDVRLAETELQVEPGNGVKSCNI